MSKTRARRRVRRRAGRHRRPWARAAAAATRARDRRARAPRTHEKPASAGSSPACRAEVRAQRSARMGPPAPPHVIVSPTLSRTHPRLPGRISTRSHDARRVALAAGTARSETDRSGMEHVFDPVPSTRPPGPTAARSAAPRTPCHPPRLDARPQPVHATRTVVHTGRPRLSTMCSTIARCSGCVVAPDHYILCQPLDCAHSSTTIVRGSHDRLRRPTGTAHGHPDRPAQPPRRDAPVEAVDGVASQLPAVRVDSVGDGAPVAVEQRRSRPGMSGHRHGSPARESRGHGEERKRMARTAAKASRSWTAASAGSRG